MCCTEVMVLALVQSVIKQDQVATALLCRHPLYSTKYGHVSRAVAIAVERNNLGLVKTIVHNKPYGRLDEHLLHVAVRSGSVELAEYLCWKVVNIDYLDVGPILDLTPLDVALNRGWEPMVQMLRRLGARTASQLHLQREADRKMKDLALTLASPTLAPERYDKESHPPPKEPEDSSSPFDLLTKRGEAPRFSWF